jgi:hypothetical protein
MGLNFSIFFWVSLNFSKDALKKVTQIKGLYSKFGPLDPKAPEKTLWL